MVSGQEDSTRRLGRTPAVARYAPRDSVTVVPDSEYAAGATHRFLFGSRYRNLWTTPIRVPVLSLRNFAGGLKVKQRGGGKQTKSLRFDGSDGREYQFRSLSKDATALLPKSLRETFAADVLQDQLSSGHPAGALIVAPILDAAGVLNARPILVQMADDAGLGEHRGEFAGLLGTIEERPANADVARMTFAGARDIEGTDDLDKATEKDPSVRVDARALLAARLTDVFIGDWDRHRDQWRWAEVGTGAGRRWAPIPRDRDQAFVRFDGLLVGQARRVAPQLLNFGPEYGDVIGATWNGRDIDRRYLTSLERPVWDSVGAALKSRLTDSVIAVAVQQLPPEFAAAESPRLERALRIRRDNLSEMWGKYYRLLARHVDIFATDLDDEASVSRDSGGATTVSLSANGSRYYSRVFSPDETDEVRVYLQGGDDKLLVAGSGSARIRVRAIGGGGDDDFQVRRNEAVHLYDHRGKNQATGDRIDSRSWEAKADSGELPIPDWGHRTLRLLTGSVGVDVGALIGYGGNTRYYGFRRFPYATRLDYRLQYSTGRQAFRFMGGVTRQFENSPAFASLGLLASGIELVRWYGFADRAPANAETAFYNVHQHQGTVALKLGRLIGERSSLTVGPVLRWSNTDLDEAPNRDRFIGLDRPYGTGSFGMVGLGATLELEGRDHPGFARRGGFLRVHATAHPAALDLVEATGRVDVEGSIALSFRDEWSPSLTLFAGGTATWGQLPFFEAPTLGGRRTLRGYRPDRFAGENVAHGSAEVRLPLTHLRILVPGHQGVFAFADAGLVHVSGFSSGDVLHSYGGGVWMSVLGRGNVGFVGVGFPGKGDEGPLITGGIGFTF